MLVQLTEADRHDLRDHAWNMVRKLALPRKVRLLLRDKIVLDLIPRLIAAREKELTEKWSPTAPAEPVKLILPD